jgi:hypothetical protein
MCLALPPSSVLVCHASFSLPHFYVSLPVPIASVLLLQFYFIDCREGAGLVMTSGGLPYIYKQACKLLAAPPPP